MNASGNAQETAAPAEHIGLVESLEREWLKLPLAAVREVGPAAQTLGGLLRITRRETFTSAANIARQARLPVPTVRKHLASLAGDDWIQNAGREQTRRGRLRRTPTIRVGARTIEAAREYGVLPWWACCQARRTGRLPWSARVVLSIVLARLMALKAATEGQDGHGLEAGDVWGSIENMGSDDRFRFSLARLERETGLTRRSIIDAKARLHRLGIIEWMGSRHAHAGDDTDVLMPRCEFQVLVTPAGPGHCYVEFSAGNRDS